MKNLSFIIVNVLQNGSCKKSDTFKSFLTGFVTKDINCKHVQKSGHESVYNKV